MADFWFKLLFPKRHANAIWLKARGDSLVDELALQQKTNESLANDYATKVLENQALLFDLDLLKASLAVEKAERERLKGIVDTGGERDDAWWRAQATDNQVRLMEKLNKEEERGKGA